MLFIILEKLWCPFLLLLGFGFFVFFMKHRPQQKELDFIRYCLLPHSQERFLKKQNKTLDLWTISTDLGESRIETVSLLLGMTWFHGWLEFDQFVFGQNYRKCSVLSWFLIYSINRKLMYLRKLCLKDAYMSYIGALLLWFLHRTDENTFQWEACGSFIWWTAALKEIQTTAPLLTSLEIPIASCVFPNIKRIISFK